MSKNSQNKLWEGEWWEEHWQDMPEFVMEDELPFSSIMIHFANREDMEVFSKLIGQKIYKTTQSLWFPEAKIKGCAKKRYVTEKYNK